MPVCDIVKKPKNIEIDVEAQQLQEELRQSIDSTTQKIINFEKAVNKEMNRINELKSKNFLKTMAKMDFKKNKIKTHCNPDVRNSADFTISNQYMGDISTNKDMMQSLMESSFNETISGN